MLKLVQLAKSQKVELVIELVLALKEFKRLKHLILKTSRFA